MLSVSKGQSQPEQWLALDPQVEFLGERGQGSLSSAWLEVQDLCEAKSNEFGFFPFLAAQHKSFC